MNDATVLRRSPQAVAAEVGDEIVFLHEDDSVYYSLDGVGAFLWRALARPRTVQQLIDLVLEEYDVGTEQFRADLDALAGALRAKGLLEIDAH